MRNLNDVINAIIEVAPDLEEHFTSVKESVKFAAPEMMYLHWNRTAELLSEHASKHPDAEKIAKIFSGTENV